MGTGSLVKRSNTGQEGLWANKFIFLNLFPYLHACEGPLPALSFLWLKSLQNCLLSQGRIFLMAIFGPLQADFCLFTQRLSHHYSCTHFLHSLPVTRQPSFGSTDLLSFPVGPCYLCGPVAYLFSTNLLLHQRLFKHWCSLLITSFNHHFLNICSLTPF